MHCNEGELSFWSNIIIPVIIILFAIYLKGTTTELFGLNRLVLAIILISSSVGIIIINLKKTNKI